MEARTPPTVMGMPAAASEDPPRRTRRPLAGGALAVLTIIGVMAASLLVPRTQGQVSCAPIGSHPEWSVARRWDEALLDAIRRALPNPPVHARNLFHVSVAMWDAWAAYDPTASGYIFTEKHTASDVTAARNEAISYAAYRVLTARYIKAVGADDVTVRVRRRHGHAVLPDQTTPRLTATRRPPSETASRRRCIAYGLADGSNQATATPTPTTSRSIRRSSLRKPGTHMSDPNRWQPLQIDHMISQNGIPVTNGVQQAVGTHWGHVTPFALPDGGRHGRADRSRPAASPRRPGDRRDLQGPGGRGHPRQQPARPDPSGSRSTSPPGPAANNDLGTNDGHGHAVNPATGQPYPPDVVNEADFGRVMAEFWADGPNSETPPGHWNVLANLVSDELAPNLRIGWERADRRPAPVGRQAVLRPQRRRP